METQQKASLGKRFIASFIDYLAIGCFFMMYTYKFGVPNEDGGYTVSGLKVFVPLIFWFIYLVIIETLINATLGHFILGMKVVKIDNSRIDFTKALKRHLVDPIDFFLLGIPAMICINNTALNQRIGDLWAKTIVINDKDK